MPSLVGSEMCIRDRIYRGLLPPWRRTGAYCAQHSAVLLLVLVLLGCECQTEQFPGPALAYMRNESTRGQTVAAVAFVLACFLVLVLQEFEFRTAHRAKQTH